MNSSSSQDRWKVRAIFGRLLRSAIVLLGIQNAQASLINDTVTGELFFGVIPINYFLPGNNFVPAGACQSLGATSVVFDPNAACGPEFQFQDPSPFVNISVDISGETISITESFTSSFDFAPQVIILSDLDWLPQPGSVTGFVLLSDTAPNSPFSIFTTPDSVRFEWAGGTADNSPFGVSIRLITTHSVPEPVTIALIGLALAGIGYGRHRSMKTA